jgi:hypothetical protein
VRTVCTPQGKAMYVASAPDWEWLLNEQRKLYTRSRADPDYVFRRLWGLVTDLRNLRGALARVARNKGRRTAGVDGMTVRNMLAHDGVDNFVGQLRERLRSGNFTPSPVRRVLIPKAAGQNKIVVCARRNFTVRAAARAIPRRERHRVGKVISISRLRPDSRGNFAPSVSPPSQIESFRRP